MTEKWKQETLRVFQPAAPGTYRIYTYTMAAFCCWEGVAETIPAGWRVTCGDASGCFTHILQNIFTSSLAAALSDNLSHIWIGSNWRLDQAWKRQAAKKIKMTNLRVKDAPGHFHVFVGCRKHSFSTHMLLLSCFSCVQLFATLWTVANQAPLSKGFSRQKYWSGLPRPPLGDLPGPGLNSHLRQVLYH